MSLYQTQVADRLEQFAQNIVSNIDDPAWRRETFEDELRTIRTLAGCIEDDALMRRVSEGIDELLQPLHPHAPTFLVPGCADTNLKRACAIAEQAKALALELRDVDAEPGAGATDGGWIGPLTTEDCAKHFDISENTWRNWADGKSCPKGLSIRNVGRGRWQYRNEAQLPATKHNT